MKANEQYISELIYKSFVEELSATEKDDLEIWLSHEDNQRFYNELKNSESINSKIDIYDSFNANEAFSKIHERIDYDSASTTKHIVWRYLKVAAVIFVVVGLGWLASTIDSGTTVETAQLAVLEKSNPNGRKTTFELPDGSIVNLNSASKLKYFEDTENNRRIVHLDGEAFFDVAKDPSRPFSVVSGNISTTAIGTSFNVSAYSKENNYKVVLVSGKVEVVNRKDSKNDRMFLTPGFAVSYSNISGDLTKYNFDREYELAWKNSTLFFDESDLDNVIKELERWYGVNISIENKHKVGNWKYSSKFKNESLANVLDGISYIQEFEYEINGKEVTLKF